MRRGLAAGGLTAVAVIGGVVACQPVDEDLNPSTAAATTDQQGTEELERQHVDVAWLSCSGTYVDGGSSSSPSEVEVNCQGKTQDGQDIVLKGTVHGVVSGHCVRGSLTATVGGKEWFHLGVLGNCAEQDNSGEPATSEPPKEESPTQEPPKEEPPKEEPPKEEPSHQEPAPGATTTVTVTATATATATTTAPPPDPSCSCFQGK
ncbi:hypothetical protein GTY65_16475 [Streptomyces sp. SID8379]|uniref:hypothetical protein n=1 Tax=unclassified Streptomyces TaxID=2593676 RepID=UPI0003773006|nr:MULTISPECIES: hypothetical protein [unclassified Streptomyces]MYW65640.1 hypothetical protein [Streptomyces sp. SID8379]